MADTNNGNNLTFADAVDATFAKDNRGGWYNGLCPAHDDSTPSLGIKERPDGSFAVKCQAGCTRDQVIAALEQKTGKRYSAKQEKDDRPQVERGITLQQYADLKKLPPAYLRSFSTFEKSYNGRPAVVHTYFDETVGIKTLAGARVGFKYRLSSDSHDTVWVDHRKSVPYGLAHLWWYAAGPMPWDDRQQKIEWMVVCEGESDVQTLFFAGVPAIGVSGKKGWRPEFAGFPQLADVKEVYIVQEPEAEDFVAEVSASFPDKRVYVIPFQEPVKDPSALWISNPNIDDFWKSWGELMDRALLINDGFAKTDTGNAERLVHKHGPNFRWVTGDETFCVWVTLTGTEERWLTSRRKAK